MTSCFSKNAKTVRNSGEIEYALDTGNLGPSSGCISEHGRRPPTLGPSHRRQPFAPARSAARQALAAAGKRVFRDAPARGGDRAGRRVPVPRARHRRDRLRQGRGGSCHPCGRAAPREAFRRDQLRRPRGVDRREPALRPRKGGVHRRPRAVARRIPRGARRRPVPRRDRGDADRAPAETFAGAPTGRRHAGRLDQRPPRGRAGDRRHEPRSWRSPSPEPSPPTWSTG